MKTLHTKGQWKAEPSSNNVDWLVQSDKDSILITLEYGLSPIYQNYQRAEANAKLASSAPDLLDACNAVLTAWHSKPSNMYKKEPAYLEQIRKAIKKAIE